MTNANQDTKVKYRGILLSEKPVKDKEWSDEDTTYYNFKGKSIEVDKEATGYGKVKACKRWFFTMKDALIYIEKNF